MRYLALAAVTLVLTAFPAHAKDGVTADARGITAQSGDLELSLGGRLHLDAAVFDDPSIPDTGITDAAVRRARLELSGKLGNSLRFRVDREFAGKSKGWRNLWLAYSPVDWLEIKGGNLIVPFSMEDLQSSSTMPFVEHSLASGLAPGFGLGGAATANGKNWSASAGYFTDALSNEVGQSTERGRGVVGRVPFAPINAHGNVIHFALAGERRSFDATERMRFSADPGSPLAPRLMSSGAIGGLDHSWAWNGEAGAAFGPLLVQAQITGVRMSRPLENDLSFSGQTVQAGWLVTGGRYNYAEKQGVFGGPNLKRGKGAIEVVARYSRLDLDDATVNRGIGRAITGGANWYINRNLRVMANYTESRVHFPGTITPDEHNKVGVARLQVNF